MQEFQTAISEETESSSSDNLHKAIFCTLSDLCKIESLFHGIRLISIPSTEGITDLSDVVKAIEAIYAIACQGAEFSLEVANKLDRAEMAGRNEGKS